MGAQAPALRADLLQSIAHERAGRVMRLLPVAVALLVIVAVVLAVGVQWFRPLPAPVFRPGALTTVQFPGTAPQLPWPTTGSAALALDGDGMLGHVGSTKPVPMAGLAKVMAAYVVLVDHPLALGNEGPPVPVTAAAIATYQAEKADQQSVVPLAAGETLTEHQALEGLLVASGNDMAGLLAEWDAGTTAGFVTKMNARARTLGLASTRFTDPSGLDAGSVSTPADLVRLGHAAMAAPTFREIVAMPQVTLPLAGLVYNPNSDVGHGGVVGIKTGTDAAAGGCFLFEARTTANGASVTLDGAVLGQQTSHPTAAALAVGAALVKAAFASMGSVPVLRTGQQVGRVVAPWGASVPVTAQAPPDVLGWPGMTAPVRIRVGRLSSSMPAGTRIGVLGVTVGGRTFDVVLRTAGGLPGPSATWRLTR